MFQHIDCFRHILEISIYYQKVGTKGLQQTHAAVSIESNRFGLDRASCLGHNFVFMNVDGGQNECLI